MNKLTKQYIYATIQFIIYASILFVFASITAYLNQHQFYVFVVFMAGLISVGFACLTMLSIAKLVALFCYSNFIKND